MFSCFYKYCGVESTKLGPLGSKAAAIFHQQGNYCDKYYKYKHVWNCAFFLSIQKILAFNQNKKYDLHHI